MIDKAIGLYFQLNRPNMVQSISFDAFINESHNLTAEITQIPLETGAYVSDHLIFKPLVLSITAVVSNTPLRYFGGVDNIFRGIQLVKDLFDGSSDYRRTFAQEAWMNLLETFSAAGEMTITTANAVYPNMVLIGLDTTTDANSSEILEVNMTFQQIIRHTTDLVADENLGEGIYNKAVGQRDLGAVSYIPMTSEGIFDLIVGVLT